MEPTFVIVTVSDVLTSVKLSDVGVMLIAGERTAACDSLLSVSNAVTSYESVKEMTAYDGNASAVTLLIGVIEPLL